MSYQIERTKNAQTWRNQGFQNLPLSNAVLRVA